jgi:hypothetical protein
MANAFTTLGLLEAEIETRIGNLTPNYFSNERFKLRPQESRRSTLLQSGGKPRLFELGDPIFTDDANLYWGGGGKGIHNPAVFIPINIVYPTTDRVWRKAAYDDGDQIRADILNNRDTEPAGVEIREIKGIPTFEKSPEDDFEVLTLFLWAVLTVE